jgi:hypothetical protein
VRAVQQRAVRLRSTRYPRARVSARRTPAGRQRWAIQYFQAPGQEIAPALGAAWLTAARAADWARRNGLEEIARLTGRHAFEVPTFTNTTAIPAVPREDHES